MSYVESVGVCERCGETSVDGHENGDGARLCCGCWHSTSVDGVPVDPDAARKLSQAADKARGWTDRRDRLIVAAVQAGGSLREVAETVGLSHTAVAKIVKRAGRHE